MFCLLPLSPLCLKTLAFITTLEVTTYNICSKAYLFQEISFKWKYIKCQKGSILSLILMEIWEANSKGNGRTNAFFIWKCQPIDELITESCVKVPIYKSVVGLWSGNVVMVGQFDSFNGLKMAAWNTEQRCEGCLYLHFEWKKNQYYMTIY